MVDHENRQRKISEVFSDIRAKQAEKRLVKEPPIIAKIREGLRDDFVCGFCDAAGRADVFYRPDLSEKGEIVVEVECRAFKDGKKCGNVETRYY